MEGVLSFILILVVLAAFISWAWLLVNTFRTHILWGVGYFFLTPIVSVLFLFMHTDKAWKPFLIGLVSFAVFYLIEYNFSDLLE